MNVIVAVDQNWAIGKDGDQLIYLSEDLKRFKSLTTGHPVILGRKTLATFPGGRPLKGRRNLILSRNTDFAPEGAEVFSDVETLRAAAPEDAFVIGGASVYRQLLPWCDTAYVTKIDRAPKSRGLPRTAGHKKGAQVFQDIANYCDELGVESVYFYAFSTENWKRPAEEVGAIMRLFGEYLIKGFDYKNRNIRICFMGDRTALDPKLQKLMNELETDSASKTGLTINIAVNYGGRPEIVRAAQSLAAKVAAGEMKPEDITEEALSAQMYTAGQKDPDFILRPSGEKRLSNFMLWQAAYSELVEMDVLWPDFTRDDLDAAIMEFNRRSRRFGGL